MAHAHAKSPTPGIAMLATAASVLALAPPAPARDIHVATRGDDTAAGDSARPLRTINAAAAAAQPGDRVVVHAGVYREWVQPQRGGTSEATRITYMAAPDEEVVIKGSERIRAWRRDGGVWIAQVANGLFGDYNPFAQTLSGGWLLYGDWNHRGEVYAGGAALAERASIDEVRAAAGTWHTAGDATTTTITANFGSDDPRRTLVEIGVRPSGFYPRKLGLDYITVDGFRITQTSPNWGPPNAEQQAGLGSRGGAFWIMRHNEVSYSKAACISIGRAVNPPPQRQAADTGTEQHSVAAGPVEIFDRDMRDIAITGHQIIRDNHIHHCGQAGIIGAHNNSRSLIAHNLIEDINWRDAYGGHEVAGIKFHGSVDTIIKDNAIRRVRGKDAAFAIWLDHHNQNARITGNVLLEAEKGGIYFEANRGPLLVDNNIIIGPGVTTKAGIWERGSEAGVFLHNLIHDADILVTDDSPVVDFQQPARTVGWFKAHSLIEEPDSVLPLAVRNDRWFSNIFIRGGAQRVRAAMGMRFDHNLYLQTAFKTRWDAASVVSPFHPAFAYVSQPARIEVTFNMPGDFDTIRKTLRTPLVTTDFIGDFAGMNLRVEAADGGELTFDRDYFGKPYAGGPVVGPFADLKSGANRFTVFTAYRRPTRIRAREE